MIIMTLQHYKHIVLQKIKEDKDPNDRHIKEWTAPHIQVKRLLKDMQKENLIHIEYVKDGGTVRRILTPIIDDYKNYEDLRLF